MDDLVEFLRARLAEDEAVARAATAGPWRHSPDKHHHIVGTPLFEEAVFAGATGQEAICVAGTGETEDRQSMADAAHIARHDPARVLAEVEAKRNLIDSAAGARHDRDYWSARLPSDSAELLKTIAVMEARWSAWHYVLTQLAASYVDHPDYRPELIVPA